MTRLALAVPAALLLASVAAAEDKPATPAITEVMLDVQDKLGVKPGLWSKPTVVTSAEELEKLVEDKATRERLAKAVDLKTHNLLIFRWQGSGMDKLDHTVMQSKPEQVAFTWTRGLTKDLRQHAHLFAVRKDVRWTTK